MGCAKSFLCPTQVQLMLRLCCVVGVVTIQIKVYRGQIWAKKEFDLLIFAWELGFVIYYQNLSSTLDFISLTIVGEMRGGHEAVGI